MDLYQELDVPRDATSELIKQHYRSLAQQHHPDKGGDEERFKAIKKAYEILIDPDKRRLYDEVGEITPGFSLRSEAIGELSECLKGILPNINLHTESLVKRMRDAVLQKRMHHLTKHFVWNSFKFINDQNNRWGKGLHFLEEERELELIGDRLIDYDLPFV